MILFICDACYKVEKVSFEDATIIGEDMLTMCTSCYNELEKRKNNLKEEIYKEREFKLKECIENFIKEKHKEKC